MSDAPIEVIVTHRFAAAPERVFDAWLDPKIASRFLFATSTGEMVRAETDPRVGGRYIFIDRRDGEDVAHFGEYLEIDRPRRLVFTFAVTGFEDHPATVAVEIAPDGDGCRLTLTQTMPADFAEFKDRTQKGWAMILQNLEKAL